MSSKRFTRAEVASYNTKDNSIIIIHNHVYDLNSFLDEHPGGHEVLVNVVGKDASEDFDDIGHSLDAKELMKKYIVGELVDEEKTADKKKPAYTSSVTATTSHRQDDAYSSKQEEGGLLASWKLPLILGILATLIYHYVL